MKGSPRDLRTRRATLALGVLMTLTTALAPAAAFAQSSKPAEGAGGAAPASQPETGKKPKVDPATVPVKPKINPQHIQVQHILIGFKGSVPGKNITRTKDEAKALAAQILEESRKGTDFNLLVEKFTDDSPPGIYGMSNFGVPPNSAEKEFERSKMVPAFGNVGFAISPGNIDVAEYDPKASPYGWHIIKRLK